MMIKFRLESKYKIYCYHFSQISVGYEINRNENYQSLHLKICFYLFLKDDNFNSLNL